jgi:hypothetical protein
MRQAQVDCRLTVEVSPAIKARLVCQTNVLRERGSPPAGHVARRTNSPRLRIFGHCQFSKVYSSSQLV